MEDRLPFHFAAECEYEIEEGGVWHTMFSDRRDSTVA